MKPRPGHKRRVYHLAIEGTELRLDNTEQLIRTTLEVAMMFPGFSGWEFEEIKK